MKIISKLLIIAVLVNITFTSCAKNPKENINLDNKQVFDAIIVPGVPYNDESWSKILMSRIYWSYHLYSQGITKNIIYSGSAVYTPYIESEIMAMYGKAMGIPDSVIYTETNAEHSVENVYYSYQIAKDLGFEKIALATDPFQSKMMEGPSNRMNVNIEFIPFSTEMLDTLKINDYNIPDDKAFVENFVSLTERKNFFQRFRGTLGGNLNLKD